jgi:hypothetical protein
LGGEMSKKPIRFFASSSKITEIVHMCKIEFFTKNPQYQEFEDEISSYVFRAVEKKNERGLVRPDDYFEDQKAQAEYFDYLAAAAKSELARCRSRYKDRLLKETTHSKETTLNSTHNRRDDYNLLTNLS